MLMPLVLIVVGALCRILPHPPNAVAIGAVALFAGAKLPRRYAWLIPLAAMALADVVIDWGHSERAIWSLSRVTIYGTYATIALMGLVARRASGWSAPLTIGALSLCGSGLFFITTNLSAWVDLYPQTWDGLVACYVAALPFLNRTVLADLAGLTVLYSCDYAFRRLAARHGMSKPARQPELLEA
jgi:hypothetical protein